MTDTPKNTNTNNSISILKEIKEKGYIKSDQTPQYMQKLNYALNTFFKTKPERPQQIIECMQYLTNIGKLSNQFLPVFQDKIFALYDMAMTGNDIIKNQATTNLLVFFSYISPESEEQKNRILDLIQNLPDFHKRRNEITRVTSRMVFHYEQNHQEPNPNILEKMSHILTKLSNAPMQRGRVRSSGNIFEQKENLQQCANFIKKRAPELYEKLWERKFKPKRKVISRYWELKEPTRVFLSKQIGAQGRYFID